MVLITSAAPPRVRRAAAIVESRRQFGRAQAHQRRCAVAAGGRVTLNRPGTMSILNIIAAATTATTTAAPTAAAATAPAAVAPTSTMSPDVSDRAQLLVLATLLVISVTTAARRDGFARLGLTAGDLRRAIVPGVLAVIIVLPLMFAASEITELIWQAIKLEHPSEHELLHILGESSSPALRVGVIVSALVL